MGGEYIIFYKMGLKNMPTFNEIHIMFTSLIYINNSVPETKVPTTHRDFSLIYQKSEFFVCKFTLHI